MNNSRRDTLKKLGVGTAWVTPIIQTITLPAHAQTSGTTTNQPTSTSAPVCQNGRPGTVVNPAVEPGCVGIYLDSGERLLPTNIDEFDINFVNGLRLFIEFEDAPNTGTPCSGKIVKLICVLIQ